MEAVKSEVFAKEKDLKNVAIMLTKIIAFSNTFGSRWMDDETLNLEKRWLRNRVEQLLSQFKVEGSRRMEAMKYLDGIDRLDGLENKEEREKEWTKFLVMIKEDLKSK